MRNLLSIKELASSDIYHLLKKSAEIKQKGFARTLEGKVMACCFFEPSTRTRLSFETAMLRLGGSCIGFADEISTSLKKGESLADTIKVVGGYCDLLVLRHPEPKAAQLAALATTTRVINAGDGANEHPTQTLIDLFSIQECMGKLENLRIILAGDLLYGRAAHSLAIALRLFSPTLFFVAPDSLQMPAEICELLTKEGICFSLHSSLEEVIGEADILYMTRVQKERCSSIEQIPFKVTAKLLENAPSHLRLLHPLPRVDEIDPDVDDKEHSYYFTQAENGVYVRAALLCHLLEGK